MPETSPATRAQEPRRAGAPVGIELVRGRPNEELRSECARFLARFVQEGHLPRPFPGDESEDTWNDRLRWWWIDNPCAEDETPTAIVLRADGQIVGFHGLIPFDYITDGLRVPSLVAAAFFVDPAWRGHSMKIFLKVERLARQFAIVDGSASPEVASLLQRFGYEPAPPRSRTIYAARSTFLGRVLRPFLPVPEPSPRHEQARIVRNPGHVRPGPPHHDGRIRPDLRPEVLGWICRSGTNPRQSVGLVDPNDVLLACVVGFPKQARGITAFRILYSECWDDGDALRELAHRIVTDPHSSGLPAATQLILWSWFDGDTFHPGGGWTRPAPFLLFHKTPEAFRPHSRHYQAGEGDLILL